MAGDAQPALAFAGCLWVSFLHLDQVEAIHELERLRVDLRDAPEVAPAHRRTQRDLDVARAVDLERDQLPLARHVAVEDDRHRAAAQVVLDLYMAEFAQIRRDRREN